MNPTSGHNDNKLSDFMLAEFELLLKIRQDLITTAESRVNFYMATVSGAILAMGLLDMPGSRIEALLIGCFIFVSLAIFGVVIFLQMVERNMGVIKYTQSLNLIRGYFAQQDHREEKANITNYLTFPLNHKEPGFTAPEMHMFLGFGHLFGVGQLVAFINSFLIGAGTAIGMVEFQVPEAKSFWYVAFCGAIIMFLSRFLHHVYYLAQVIHETKKLEDSKTPQDKWLNK